jgi:hypothetical protein
MVDSASLKPDRPATGSRYQLAMAVTAIVPAVLAIGFIGQLDWARDLWPFEISQLTSVFLGSILAAIAVPILWIAARREWAALSASALFPMLMLAGMSVYLVEEELADDAAGLIGFALAMAVGAAYALVLAVAGSRFPLRDGRPVPLVVRGSFAAFGAVLSASGIALVLGADKVLPWSVGKQTAVMAGIIFLGAASNYVYGTVRPLWGYVCPPLLGFMVYDVILLGPLINHFGDVAPEQRTSLIVYIAVLAYSAALGAYFLLINRRTRLWGARTT